MLVDFTGFTDKFLGARNIDNPMDQKVGDLSLGPHGGRAYAVSVYCLAKHFFASDFGCDFLLSIKSQIRG